ncbi:34957_t:CDS:2 [Gigaspora margarita]|uniref:34957_t:CDS:1 n=1 Tax=Gigaspora margarita TaxID=4874 RepID=A0ABN7UQA0_GIGMA|nr:34957_t:CDS:2 [Gigaspora margarita]
MDLEKNSLTKMVQNPAGNAKIEAPILQIISELTKTIEIWDRDELSIIGFENPRESNSLKTGYKKPLALLILLYNINTDAFKTRACTLEIMG